MSERRDKAKAGKSLRVFILKKTYGTASERLTEGDYSGFITELRADPDNTGVIYIGTSESGEYPLSSDDSRVTGADLDKLFVRASAAGQILHIWGEEES